MRGDHRPAELAMIKMVQNKELVPLEITLRSVQAAVCSLNNVTWQSKDGALARGSCSCVVK